MPMRDQERSPAMTPERVEQIREKVALARAKKPDSLIVADFDYLLEALAVLGRQLAEKDEALRLIGTPAWHDSSLSARELVDALVAIAREALRAEPAKEETRG